MRSIGCFASVCVLLALAGCLDTPIKRITQDSSIIQHDGGFDAGPDADVPQPCDTDEQCTDKRASRCGPDHLCIPCGDNIDCGKFPDAHACIPDVGCFECDTGETSACTGDTKVCDLTSHACVQCTADNDVACTGDTDLCDTQHGTCVQCLSNAECTDPASSVCSDHECVGCSDKRDCSHIEGKNECNQVDRTCVECTEHTQCPATNPVCAPATNECKGCTFPADCGNYPDTPVCLVDTGACVECTPDSEAQDCGSKACDPALYRCTDTDRNSVDTCGACVSDSECKADRRCVPLFHGEEKVAQGGHCMKIAAAGCAEPYSGIPISRESLSGEPAEPYCGFSELLSSCEAILALEATKACPTGDALECDAVGARCETVNFTANKCTYGCTSSATCPVDFPCNGVDGDKYCGGPAM